MCSFSGFKSFKFLICLTFQKELECDFRSNYCQYQTPMAKFNRCFCASRENANLFNFIDDTFSYQVEPVHDTCQLKVIDIQFSPRLKYNLTGNNLCSIMWLATSIEPNIERIQTHSCHRHLN
ncbi:hypothetical protein RF11_15066 [Thelohanellus kitauei]|uniref:Uncharacterized protein n=1 Tax=Thelohanellus kitauei TaxID=669202 RepID=A0A0C2MFI0_THEKT|nr:hypothetical protein RF11_15066 [Thelohanellus kitauei]